ncbi:MAG: 30S ribosomal protein S2 [Candidatus Omnitrophica bacterium]|nr:30S ribosomal protein S2 [Candidatus Omnitrophota bacterium]
MEISLKELLEAGVYFGHPTRQFDPRIKPYLYGKRQGIYIIDIEKTIEKIKESGEFLKKIVSQNKKILFVGTKKQAQTVIKEIAEKCNMPYVNYRWIGGTLTNFKEIRKRINRLEEIEMLENSGKINLYTKKEILIIQKEKEDLKRKFEGIRIMTEYPGAVVVVDVKREINAIKESKKVNIPIVGIVDTNGNPEIVDYPIPANDDGLKSIQTILLKLADYIIEGLKETEFIPETIEKKKNEENYE